jgi:uncharacterized protein
MLAKLTPEEIEGLLHREIIGRLACHADTSIYVVPISYAYDGKYIYCHTYEGMKMELLRKDPNVCFQVDEMKNMANWKSVIAWGDFEELTEKKERKKAFRILMNRHLPVNSSITTHLGPSWPFSSDNVDNIEGIFFRIYLHKKTGRFENDQATASVPG